MLQFASNLSSMNNECRELHSGNEDWIQNVLSALLEEGRTIGSLSEIVEAEIIRPRASPALLNQQLHDGDVARTESEERSREVIRSNAVSNDINNAPEMITKAPAFILSSSERQNACDELLKPFKCTLCQSRFEKSRQLLKHVRNTHPTHKKEVVCPHAGCGKTFQREYTYRTHYRNQHMDQPAGMCEVCGRTFTNSNSLREHRFKHASTNEYPHKCEDCGKAYTSHRSFKNHRLRHAGIKNFECPYCGVKKTTRNELRTHINYHTKEKQWPCQHCPSVFNSPANLGLHDRVVHQGIRRHACRYCDRTFGKPDTRKHHEMRHTGEKPHSCEICSKRFIQLVTLKKHMKTHEMKEQK